MEEKKRSNKALIVVIIILVIVLLGLGGYILIDKGIIKLKSAPEIKEKKPKKEIKEEKLALDDPRFYPIYNELKSYTYNKNRSDGYESFSERELTSIGSRNLQESDFTKTDEVAESGYPYYTFAGETLVNYLKKYFGSHVRLNKDYNIYGSYITPNVDFYGSGMSIVLYDNRTDKFKVYFSGIGGTSGPQAKVEERKIVSATLKEDTIIVKEKAIYYNFTGDDNFTNFNYKIYSDKDLTNQIDSIDFTGDNIMQGSIVVDSYLDKASTITYTFKQDKQTNNYYFASSNIE